MYLLEQEIKRKCKELDVLYTFGMGESKKAKKLLQEIKALQEKQNEAQRVFDSNFSKKD